MDKQVAKRKALQTKRLRVRKKIAGSAEKPRLLFTALSATSMVNSSMTKLVVPWFPPAPSIRICAIGQRTRLPPSPLPRSAKCWPSAP